MKPLNIFALIDEEAIYPNGTDISLLQKVKQQHRSNELFQDRLFWFWESDGIKYQKKKIKFYKSSKL